MTAQTHSAFNVLSSSTSELSISYYYIVVFYTVKILGQMKQPIRVLRCIARRLEKEFDTV